MSTETQVRIPISTSSQVLGEAALCVSQTASTLKLNQSSTRALVHQPQVASKNIPDLRHARSRILLMQNHSVPNFLPSISPALQKGTDLGTLCNTARSSTLAPTPPTDLQKRRETGTDILSRMRQIQESKTPQAPGMFYKCMTWRTETCTKTEMIHH